MLGMFRWGLTEAALRSGDLPDGTVAIVVEATALAGILRRLRWLRDWWLVVGAGAFALVLPLALPVIAVTIMTALWVAWLRQGPRHPSAAQVAGFAAVSIGGFLVPWILTAVTTGTFSVVFGTLGAPWMACVASAVEDGGAVVASLPLVLLWRHARQPLVVVRRPLRA
jgi:hypothetical protein